MWKVLGIFALAIALTIGTTNVTKSSMEFVDEFADFELNDDVVKGQKVAEGVKPNRTFGKDYALISISFVDQKQICGGALIRAEWVVTTASCLSDPVEGIASNVFIALGKSKRLRFNFSKIFINPDYDYTTHKADIALLKLSTSALVIKNKVAPATIATNSVTDFYVGNILYFCGYGQTENKPSIQLLETPAPEDFLCTELLAIPSANCSTNSNIICTTSQGDNNVCPGDFGGPLYLKGSVIGLAAWAPNLRPNAQCTDGHLTEYTSLFAYESWISTTIAANP